jgi:hypothetical protein
VVREQLCVLLGSPERLDPRRRQLVLLRATDAWDLPVRDIANE